MFSRALHTINAKAVPVFAQQTRTFAKATVAASAAAPAPAQTKAARTPPALFGQTGKYAQALFNTASKRGGNNTLELIVKDLTTFNAAYHGNSHLQQILDNPVLSAAKKAETINKVAPQIKISELATQFIAVLASKGHIELLKDVTSDYQRLVAFEKNETRVTVTSAEALDATQRQRIVEAIRKRMGTSNNTNINLTEKIDEKILGGLIVNVDDRSVDLSTATQIRKIETALKRQ